MRAASAVLFQSTALVSTMVGAPLLVASYSRLYAQSSCSPSVSNYLLKHKTDGSGSAIPTTTFVCTISSDTTLTQSYYAYGGAYAAYHGTPSQHARIDGDRTEVYMTDYGHPGLNVDVTNSADIDTQSDGAAQSILPAANDADTNRFRWSSYQDGLAVVSAGSFAFEHGGGGDGGSVTISNTGSITSQSGAGGIYALSQGGSSYTASDGGQGGVVTITSSGDVAGGRFGIAALSFGGYSGATDDDQKTFAGQSKPVTVTVTSGDISSQTGPGIIAASYSAGQFYPIRFGRDFFGGDATMTGYGGVGDTVTVNVGSSDAPFSGSITTNAPGHLRPEATYHGQQLYYGPRSTGAAIGAFSKGGNGLQNLKTMNFSARGGGNVYVNVATASSGGTLQTNGDDSPGIHAYSRGGYAEAAAGDQLGEQVLLPPKAADGGDGGAVYVTASGSGQIVTSGDHSFGIAAQSLGGGNGLYNNKLYGSPGSGGSVTVTNSLAFVSTDGNYASGILAQSGPGVQGGITSTASSEPFSWNQPVGSSTGSGTVTVTNSAMITTSGMDAHGIVAQSIGGNGGMLTSSGALSTQNGAVKTGAVQYVGAGPSAAHGADVTVTNNGTIITYGGPATTSTTGGGTSDGTTPTYGSIGILAQSIGGGGGTNFGQGAVPSIGGTATGTGEGSSGSNGGNASAYLNGTITTHGQEGHGVVVQSIGGGGGTGRNHEGLFVAIGGRGGNGGAGATAYAKIEADITTGADYANGLIVQSIGGGGGTGGKASAWGLQLPSVAVGGSGGAGGDAGEAKAHVGTHATIATSGDHAIAVHAQSVGGGGGAGGAAKSTDGGLGFSIAFASGGTAAGGGAGAKALATHYGKITTAGSDAVGILVQSIGGGGGQGGAATSKSIAEGVPISETGNTLSVSLSIAHGGNGGNGGDGGEAEAVVESSGSVTTTGDGATGVHVQSIGGGGGQGGDATATAASKSLDDLIDKLKGGSSDDDSDDDDGPTAYNLDITLALGGKGASAGHGAEAYGHILGTVITHGDLADGLLVQSIGGGGGASGSGTGSTEQVKNAVSGSLNIAVGAAGGDGGTGGRAQGGLSAGGVVHTYGVGSRGVVVHSVGGGGGAAGGGSGSDGADWSATIGLGMSGGSGGNADKAYAWNAGSITTEGDWSDGILVQSIGGGGGTGGSSSSSLSFKKKSGDDSGGDDDGGDDEGGGDEGGDDAARFGATADTSSDSDDDSGGDDDGTTTYTLNIGAGTGSGGAGGNGAEVYAGVATENGALKLGTIVTKGAFSHGIQAQSVGGGGGSAGTSNATDSSSSSSSSSDSSSGSDSDDDKTKSATLNFGTSGGSGGNGGQVTVHAADTTTHGFTSHGVVAQSIGGGGGTGVSGGFSVSKLNLKFGSGSTDSGTAIGGKVKVDTAASTTIQTYGAGALGVIAQSIGGGGGLGIVALGTADTESDDTIADVVSVTLGGGTEASSSEGATVDHSGAIVTAGKRAAGIVAQSISGGGGFLSASSANFASVSFNSSQWAAGNQGGADVSLAKGASIYTSGDGAVGVIAQVVAGGGGIAADLAQPLTVYAPSSSNAYSNGVFAYMSGASVTVSSGASITTTGDYAHGILAQSVGGSGGIFAKAGKTYIGSLNRNGGTASGTSGNPLGGTVDIDISGTVETKSDKAWAILAQNQTDTMTISVEAGGSVTGSKAAASGGTYAGGAVYALTDSGNEANVTLTVSGTLTGNVVLPSGANDDTTSTALAGRADGSRLVTTAGGRFVTGAVVDADTVVNTGTMDLGGAGTMMTTRITGDLVGVSGDASAPFGAPSLGLEGVASHTRAGAATPAFEGGAIRNFDLDLERGLSDRLVVEGNVRGTLGIDINAVTLIPVDEIELIQVGGDIDGEIRMLSGPVFAFSDPRRGADGWLRTSVTADFDGAAAGQSPTRQALAGGLQNAWDALEAGTATTLTPARGPSIGEVFARFDDVTPATFGAMVEDLSSRTALAPLSLGAANAIAAAGAAVGCPGFPSDGVMLEQSSCVWGNAYGAYGIYDGLGRESGFDARTYAMRAGGQGELADGWFLGGTMGYEYGAFSGDGRGEKLDTQSLFGALALTREFGAFELAAVAGGGYTWGESSRTIDSFGLRAEADPASSFLFARLHGAYQFALGEAAYVTPSLAVDLINLNQHAYRETGAGALNLVVEDESKVLLGISPAVEVGARVDLMPEIAMRVFAKGGLTFLSDDEFKSRTRFAGVSSMDTFDIATPISDTLATISAGIDITKDERFELRLQYDGAFSDDVQSHGGTLRLGYRF